MRFLGVTETCDLGALYMRLRAEGHEVRVFIEEPLARGTMAGLVDHSADWRHDLGWIRAAGRQGIIIFESVSEGFGRLQDGLRQEGYLVVGGSEFGDRLENDRAFGQEVLRRVGLPTARTWQFSSARSAHAFVSEKPARYVMKMSGPAHGSGDNYVGVYADGRDVLALLAVLRRSEAGAGAGLILMEHLEGVEVGVGAYFTGEAFLKPACLDWEHKRFFAGDMGELTGEMGTVATFERAEAFFEQTLSPLETLLRRHGHVGYVNLNTISNEEGIWPLEFTCRFGYPGFAVLDPLQATSWGDLLAMMVAGARDGFSAEPGFSLGIVLTAPPFPYSRKEVERPVGLPIHLPESFDANDLRHLHYGEVGLAEGQLVTTGLYGWTMVVTGTGDTVPSAKADAYDRAAKVVIPNMRYRLDIGTRLISEDYARCEGLGLFTQH